MRPRCRLGVTCAYASCYLRLDQRRGESMRNEMCNGTAVAKGRGGCRFFIQVWVQTNTVGLGERRQNEQVLEGEDSWGGPGLRRERLEGRNGGNNSRRRRYRACPNTVGMYQKWLQSKAVRKDSARRRLLASRAELLARAEGKQAALVWEGPGARSCLKKDNFRVSRDTKEKNLAKKEGARNTPSSRARIKVAALH